MSGLKAPAAKLPLAARKNVRDELDAKKPEFEEKLLKLLGVPWTFEVDPLTIWPYAEEGNYGYNALGACIYAYLDALLYTLKDWIEYNGENGANELNTIVSKHIVTVTASTKINYAGCDIEEGVLRLLFHPQKLGTNIGDTARELSEVLSSAPQPEGAAPLSYLARHAIKTDYEAKIPDLLKKAQTALHNPDLKYEPEFQEIGQKLKGLKEKDRPDRWEYNLGNFAIQYFESLIGTLESENFVEDELLREGFAEGVPNGVVKWRLVDKMNNGGKDPEVILEDGNLVIQCIPERFGVNIWNSCQKLVDIL